MLKLLTDAPRIATCGLHRFFDPPLSHVEMARPHTQGITVVNIYLLWQDRNGADGQGHFGLSKLAKSSRLKIGGDNHVGLATVPLL